MKTLLILSLFCLSLLFGASTSQVEQYLLLSNSDEQLYMLEKEFFLMAKKKEGEGYCYDDSSVLKKFKTSLQNSISNQEMQKILENYKDFTLLQFVSATSKLSYEKNATVNYLTTLNEDNSSKVRIHLVNEISHYFYNQKALLLFFNKLMKPLIEASLKKRLFTQESLLSLKKRYLDTAIKSAKEETLFATKEFSIKELEHLLVLAKTPQTQIETRAVFGAMADALKLFFYCDE